MAQRIEVPGHGIVEFPDGMSDADIASAIRQNMQVTPKKEAKSDVDIAGGILRGAGSIGATILTPIDYIARKAGIQNDFIGRTDRREAMDAGLRTAGVNTESLPFKGAKLGTEIAGTLGVGGGLAAGLKGVPMLAKAAPGLAESLATGGFSAGGVAGLPGLATRVAGGAVTGGASAGLVNPEDAKTGAVIGGAIPVAGIAANKAGRFIGGGARSTQDAEVIKKAQGFGLPLGLGDVSQSRTVQAARSILKDAPLTGGMASGAQESKQQAFNKAVGSQFGAAETKLTPEVIDNAGKKIGAELDRIWSNNVLRVSPDMVAKMQALDEIAAKLPKNEGGSLSAEVRDLYSKMQQDANGELFIPGDVANKFQSYLRRRAESSAGMKHELSDLRSTIIKTFNESVNASDEAALTTARSQYKALKTVEPLLRSAEAGVAGRSAGDVPAALLPRAVVNSYKNGPMYDLAQVGSKFLVDRTPQTGGSARAALQNAGLGLGMAGMYSGAGIPGVAAATLGGVGIQSALQSPAVLKLVQSGVPMADAIMQVSKYGLLSAPVGYTAIQN